MPADRHPACLPPIQLQTDSSSTYWSDWGGSPELRSGPGASPSGFIRDQIRRQPRNRVGCRWIRAAASAPADPHESRPALRCEEAGLRPSCREIVLPRLCRLRDDLAGYPGDRTRRASAAGRAGLSVVTLSRAAVAFTAVAAVAGSSRRTALPRRSTLARRRGCRFADDVLQQAGRYRNCDVAGCVDAGSACAAGTARSTGSTINRRGRRWCRCIRNSRRRRRCRRCRPPHPYHLYRPCLHSRTG